MTDRRRDRRVHEVTPIELGITRARWKKSLSRKLHVTDLAVLVTTTTIAMVLKFGLASDAEGPFHLDYQIFGAFIVVIWWGFLTAYRTRSVTVIGRGTDEYARIIRASIFAFGWIAILSLAFKWDMSRMYLATAFPLGVVGLLVERKLWRVRMRAARHRKHAISSALVVGGVRSGIDITNRLDRDASEGYRVTGVWVPDRTAQLNEWLPVAGRYVPVLGSDRSLADALTVTEADTVIVTDTEHLGHDGLRELMWELEGVEVDLIVSPNVIDVDAGRIHIRSLAGMPFMHVEEPQYAEAGSWPKVLFDKAATFMILLLLSPMMIAAAIAVKVTSEGPIFFKQRRVGRNGEHFDMLKFRSMRVGADSELASLLAAQGKGDQPLFKVDNDPRITRVGGFLRRYSIDELPQLFNVLRGEMSLVGPRPQRDAEVELYDHVAHRRLRVRPGLTGLWQVSGRSDLSWDDAIRLDTYYVENWSMAGDLIILWKTVSAVLKSDGAY